ncbi:unnamed protein product [Adineta ricciae]|uniref:Uncharacterized protein n=1 Tax=Adineta ricciae TaxID=249248 RepID=A0A813W8Z3_ADIRI|nr:unnamed protein product [Adineta ricciae]CAF0847924.1 unnamed protein product [Adineta ricciae]
MLTSSTPSACPACLTSVGSADDINFFRKIWHKKCFRCKTCEKQLGTDNATMRYNDDQTLYCVRHLVDGTTSTEKINSKLISSYEKFKRPLDYNHPERWSIDDVVQWLKEVSLNECIEEFQKNEIDGSVLADEADGLNENMIKQLISPIGTQLKFRKALRILRNNTKVCQKTNIDPKETQEKSDGSLQLLHTIQQQTEQIKSLVTTINTQTRQVEDFLTQIVKNQKSPPVNSFNQLSSTVQNQLLDLPNNISRISLAPPGSSASAIPAIDSLAPSLLSLPGAKNNFSRVTAVATSTDGPKGSNSVLFPAVVHPTLDGVAIKPVIDDKYNFENYGRYSVTIYDQQSDNVLVETLVNVVPEQEICMPKKFVLRDSVNNILVGATVQIKLQGQIVFTGKTDATGTVEIPSTLPKNCYDVEINSGSSQHKASVFRMIVYENRGADVSTQFICRQLQSDQLEIVLKWGLLPRDLDSHVFVSDGRHVYFRAKYQGNVSLDCDVTNGNGPETIKISLQPNLKYLYVVHRYSREGLLTKSGATVTFNNGELGNSTSPYQIVQIPVVNQPDANFWIVCEIDGTTKKIQMFENTFETHNYYNTDDIARKYFKQ